MLKLQLAELLAEREKTIYWLSKETNIRYATLWQMSRGEVGRINTDTLDRICAVLECDPGDLIVRVSAERSKKRGK